MLIPYSSLMSLDRSQIEYSLMLQTTTVYVRPFEVILMNESVFVDAIMLLIPLMALGLL
jgi:hypothetical protein